MLSAQTKVRLALRKVCSAQAKMYLACQKVRSVEEKVFSAQKKGMLSAPLVQTRILTNPLT
jgi:hypothetical protein